MIVIVTRLPIVVVVTIVSPHNLGERWATTTSTMIGPAEGGGAQSLQTGPNGSRPFVMDTDRSNLKEVACNQFSIFPTVR